MTNQSIARLILKNHNTESSGFRKEYIDYLTSSSNCYSNDINSSDVDSELKVQACSNQSIELLNRIYALLEPYALELNKFVRQKSFTITPTAPTFSREEFKENWPFQSSQVVQIYRCRFASRELSASIRVKDDVISFYLLPASEAIRQSEAEEEYAPLMIFIRKEMGTQETEWWVEGKPLTPDRLERYCLLFFDYFVKNSEKLISEKISKSIN